MLQYTQDYDDRTPGAYGNALNQGPVTKWSTQYYTWIDFVDPYVKNRQAFICPSRDGAWGYSASAIALREGYVQFGREMSYFTRPSETIMLHDTATFTACGRPHGLSVRASNRQPPYYCYGTPAINEADFNGGQPNSLKNERHNGGNNYSFMDGHVKWLSNMDTFANSATHPNYLKYWAAQ